MIDVNLTIQKKKKKKKKKDKDSSDMCYLEQQSPGPVGMKKNPSQWGLSLTREGLGWVV